MAASCVESSLLLMITTWPGKAACADWNAWLSMPGFCW